jgi:sugar phosphate isomerase/epimerase
VAIRFLFSTGSLYTYGLDRCFALAARAGFDGMEVVVDQRWDTRQTAYLADLIQKSGLPIGAFHAPFDSFRLPGWPESTPARIEVTVRMAEALGAAVVVHHLPLRWRIARFERRGLRLSIPAPGKSTYRRWLESSDGYKTLQAATPVLLCIENLPAIRIMGRLFNPALWNTATELARFPALTMDTTHLGTWGLDPLRHYEALAPRIRHIHLSNFNGQEHRRPDDGHLQLDRLLANLAATGYDGAITLELHPDALDAGASDERIAELMAGSLAFCRTKARA